MQVGGWITNGMKNDLKQQSGVSCQAAFTPTNEMLRNKDPDSSKCD